ncbi:MULTISPECIES: tyrosine-type recombinase/integrase [unclassified Microbacterium]|uniref:tyrosine-type recombinase/integrase n=1 Tax=unclassified Microbacterium TaxID=2609290 RepID=UPI0030105453
MPNPKARKNRDGSVSWRVQYRLNGSVTTETFSTFDGAQEFCDHIKVVGSAQAKEVLLARRQDRKTPTLSDWVAEYLDPASGLLTGIEDGTREGYQREADRTYLKFLGHYPVDAITEKTIGQWVAWQEQQTVYRDRKKPEDERALVSAKTVKNAHSNLSSVLAAAVKAKHRTDNPAHGTRLSKGLKREAVFLSPAEFATLLHFIPEKHRPLVLFLAGTGCRWGEATAMTWGDLTLDAELQTARVTKAWKRGVRGGSVLKHPKSSKARRTISLFPDLVAALGKPGDPAQLLFSGQTGKRVRHANFSERVWSRAVAKATDKAQCAEAGLVPLGTAPHIHDLRHTHASWLISRGVPLPYIQARLGHEKITTTVDTYGHLVPDAHEQMATVVANTLAGIAPAAMGELPSPEDDEPDLEFAEVIDEA